MAELMISLLVNLPILRSMTFFTIVIAGDFSLTYKTLVSKSVYAERIMPSRYFTKGIGLLY